MAFERPTLRQIIDRIEGDFKGALGLTTILRRSFLSTIARGLAGASYSLHGHLVFISKQIFPDQAEVEFLNRWSSIYGLERNPATFTQLQIDVTFTAAATVSAGTIYQRTDLVEYTVDTDIVAAGAGVEQGIVTASIAGSNSNLDDGETLSLQSPIANVDTDATVDSTVTEGEDEETDEALRQRLVDRIQNPPAGGKVSDYIAFAKDVSGVTRVWILPDWLGPGTVGVTFVQDNDPSIFPSVAEIALVQTSIDEQKPVTAGAVAIGPIDNPTPLTISILPNNAEVQAAITAELEDLFFREAQVKGGFQGVNLSVYTGKIPLSRINEAISIAAGEQDHILTSPVSDPEPATNNGILTLGTITFNTLV